MSLMRHPLVLSAVCAVMTMTGLPGPVAADQPSILMLAIDPGALNRVVRQELGRPAARSLRAALVGATHRVPEISDLYGPDWVVVDSLFPILWALRDAAETDQRLNEVLAEVNDLAPVRGLAITPGFGGCLTVTLSVEVHDGITGVQAQGVESDIEGCGSGDLTQVGPGFYEF